MAVVIQKQFLSMLIIVNLIAIIRLSRSMECPMLKPGLLSSFVTFNVVIFSRSPIDIPVPPLRMANNTQNASNVSSFFAVPTRVEHRRPMFEQSERLVHEEDV